MTDEVLVQDTQDIRPKMDANPIPERENNPIPENGDEKSIYTSQKEEDKKRPPTRI